MATKVGIIGTGNMLPYHIGGFRKAGAEIVAIAGINRDLADKAAAQWGIPCAYGSANELFEHCDDFDALSLVVPNALHAPMALRALEARLHVFCEKPPALNAGEMSKMLAASRRAGRRLMFDFNNRARPESLALRKLIAEGRAGRLDSAQARWVRRTGIPGFGGWFTTRAQAGGGAQIDLLHMLDLALHFLDYPEPAHVLARTFATFSGDRRFKGPWGIPDKEGGIMDVETASHAFITFKSGQALFVQTSWAELIEREEVSVSFQGALLGARMQRLFGRDGIDATALDRCELYSVNADGASRTQSLETEACPDMGRTASASNFIQSIEGSAAPLNTPEEALRLMQVIDAIYASAKSGVPRSL
jgi:predicted dehydrogenase